MSSHRRQTPNIPARTNKLCCCEIACAHLQLNIKKMSVDRTKDESNRQHRRISVTPFPLPPPATKPTARTRALRHVVRHAADTHSPVPVFDCMHAPMSWTDKHIQRLRAAKAERIFGVSFLNKHIQLRHANGDTEGVTQRGGPATQTDCIATPKNTRRLYA